MLSYLLAKGAEPWLQLWEENWAVLAECWEQSDLYGARVRMEDWRAQGDMA